METNTKNYKTHFIEVIQRAEEKAKDTIELSLDQDLFEIEDYKFDLDLYKELLSNVIAQTISNYEKIRNYYKASNEQFHFLKSVAGKDLDNNDRLDFIATVFQSYVDWEPDDKQGIKTKFDAIEQIQNLEAIVYETRTLELKKKAYLMKLEKMTKDKPEPQQEKDPLPDNPYPEIFTNDTGFAIFKRLHKKYQGDKKRWQANYSFLFYSLQKDKFIICKGREFIDFLSKHFDIDIDKIDSRQAGKNSKTTAYEAIKESHTTKGH